jgi:hypothetical protein
MKKIFSVIFLLIFLCSPFSTRYERIEPNALRNLAVVYQPYPEGAPGDTVHVAAYFGGDSAVSASWTVSYDVVTNSYGTDTFLNLKDLPQINPSPHLPDSLDFFFKVPDSVFYTTAAIQEQQLAFIRPALPSGMRSMTKNEMADFLHDIAQVNFYDSTGLGAFMAAWGAKLGVGAPGSQPLDSAIAAAAVLINTFSIKAYLFADVRAKDGKRLKVKSDFVIRYNSRFRGQPMVAAFVPVNTNPRIRWLGVYRVKGGGMLFSPNDPDFTGKFSLQYLYNELYPDSVADTVVIDTGYSYYIGADSGIVSYMRNDTLVSDTSRDKICSPAGTCQLETFWYDWFYQNLALDSVTLPLDSLVTAARTSEPVTMMLPSADPHMTAAYFWVVVYDEYLGQFNRPLGMCKRGAPCYFKYTDAYKSKKK